MPVNKIIKTISKKIPGLAPDVSIDSRGIVTLKGDAGSWEQVVEAGHLAAGIEGVRNVVNKMTFGGKSAPKRNYADMKAQGEAIGDIDFADVLIIGAGVTGCGIARELAKYKLKLLVLESGDDVAVGASRANNGNIHPGHAEKSGTLKVKLNVEGNRMYTQWAEDLGFELQRCGALGFVTSNLLRPVLGMAYKKAIKNGVDTAELVDGKRVCEIEPELAKNGVGAKVKQAIWLPTMGLVEPYKVCVALAENAAENGTRFRFNCTVANILRENGVVKGAVTNQGIIRAKYVINCAGLYADEISAIAGDECFTIHPRRGVIAILDKAATPEYGSICGELTFEDVKRTLSKANTKGGGMCRTPEWNTLMGPSAEEMPDKDDLSTTPKGLAYAMNRGDDTIDYSNIIRFFAGNRPASYTEDFWIEMSPITHGFINVGAIQSPGLAAAPAVAKMVEGILLDAARTQNFPIEEKTDWNPKRTEIPEFRNLSREERARLIDENPAYGRIICRCESITEGEILEAIHSKVMPGSIDAIKRRTRAGMGRCQGGFCQPRVLEILARETGRDPTEITLKGEGSNILLKSNRPQREEVESA